MATMYLTSKPISIRRTGRIEKHTSACTGDPTARQKREETRSPVLLVAVELPPVPVLVAGHDEERQKGERPRPGAQRGPRPVQEVLGAPPPQHGAHRAGSTAGSVAARALGRCGHRGGLLDVGHGGCAGVGSGARGTGKETEMVGLARVGGPGRLIQLALEPGGSRKSPLTRLYIRAALFWPAGRGSSTAPSVQLCAAGSYSL